MTGKPKEDSVKIVIELDSSESTKLLSLIAGAIPADMIGKMIASKVEDFVYALPKLDNIPDSEFVKIRCADRGSNPFSVICIIRENCGIGLMEGKNWMEGSSELEVRRDTAISIQCECKQVGATVEFARV